MTLSIDNPEAVEVARELAATTGGTVADAIVTALRERLERERHTDWVHALLIDPE